MSGTIARFMLVTLGLLTSVGASSHTGSNSFLYWHADREEIRLDLAITDVVPWLDSPGSLTWGQIAANGRFLEGRVREHIVVTDAHDATCPTEVSLAGLTRYGDTPHLSFALLPGCVSPSRLQYDLLFDQDPLHRALVTIMQDETASGVLSPDRNILSLQPDVSRWRTFLDFGWQGMIHLWMGYDHVLFLLTLMLAVLARPRTGQHAALAQVKDTLAVVTAFTVAHSITLVLAATGTLLLPLSLVEILIALSISLAAVLVRWPVVSLHPWTLAFGFGLIHGFGFASVLADLVSGTTLPWVPLIGFNLGLELAQVLAVLVVLPALFLLARLSAWQRFIQPLTITLVAGTGLWWAYDRLPPAL